MRGMVSLIGNVDPPPPRYAWTENDDIQTFPPLFYLLVQALHWMLYPVGRLNCRAMARLVIPFPTPNTPSASHPYACL